MSSYLTSRRSTSERTRHTRPRRSSVFTAPTIAPFVTLSTAASSRVSRGPVIQSVIRQDESGMSQVVRPQREALHRGDHVHRRVIEVEDGGLRVDVRAGAAEERLHVLFEGQQVLTCRHVI